MGKCASCLPFSATDSSSNNNTSCDPKTNINDTELNTNKNNQDPSNQETQMTSEETTQMLSAGEEEEEEVKVVAAEDAELEETTAKMAGLSLTSSDPWEYSSQLSYEECEGLLKDCTLKNTDVFIPPLKYGKCVKVYDGDTIHVVCPLFPGVISRFKIRINGIDTPELRTKDEWEKKAGGIAKKMVSDLILNQIVELKDVSTDKYGRSLSTVIFQGTDVGQWLVELGWAVPYSGSGAKQVKSTDWKSKVETYEFTAEP